jgi:hypothetical protein
MARQYRDALGRVRAPEKFGPHPDAKAANSLSSFPVVQLVMDRTQDLGAGVVLLSPRREHR